MMIIARDGESRRAGFLRRLCKWASQQDQDQKCKINFNTRTLQTPKGCGTRKVKIGKAEPTTTPASFSLGSMWGACQAFMPGAACCAPTEDWYGKSRRGHPTVCREVLLPTLWGFGESVVEGVGMLAGVDDYGELAGDAHELAGAGIGDDGDALLRCAASQGAGVLQDEAASAAV